jgi:hypothetical protein
MLLIKLGLALSLNEELLQVLAWIGNDGGFSTTDFDEIGMRLWNLHLRVAAPVLVQWFVFDLNTTSG